jgi:dihydroorotase-like cyclic amidohydrolase
MGDAPIGSKIRLGRGGAFVPIMLTHVAENKLSLEKLVCLMSKTRPNLWSLPSKGGLLQEGSDARFYDR